MKFGLEGKGVGWLLGRWCEKGGFLGEETMRYCIVCLGIALGILEFEIS
jgi:hypothetical protein